MVDIAPFIIQKPYIEIGDTTPAVQIQCNANNLDVAVEQEDNTTETFCGSYTSYKAEVWTITITGLSSFGTDGLWTKLRPLVGTVQPFTLRPNADAATSADNPEMTGEARVKAFSWLTGGKGEASEVDVVLAVQGMPTWSDVATPLAQAVDTAPVQTEETVAANA